MIKSPLDKRVFSNIIDMIFITLFYFCIEFIFNYMDILKTDYLIIYYYIFCIIIVTLMIGKNGNTFGQSLLGLRILNTNGNKLTYFHSFLRTCSFLIYFIPLILFNIILSIISTKFVEMEYQEYIFYFLLSILIYFLTIIISFYVNKRRMFHDIISKTIVIDESKQCLNVHSSEH